MDNQKQKLEALEDAAVSLLLAPRVTWLEVIEEKVRALAKIQGGYTEAEIQQIILRVEGRLLLINA